MFGHCVLLKQADKGRLGGSNHAGGVLPTEATHTQRIPHQFPNFLKITVFGSEQMNDLLEVLLDLKISHLLQSGYWVLMKVIRIRQNKKSIFKLPAPV